jgi:glycosyltransferase involved in cell wall biosynthesis
MIVKDEEKVLARCLDSLRDLADEIIIVDTGSKDNTKNIAAGYTDKIYDFTWIHDFSAARNFAFSKATMDYIYSSDADEVLDDENRERFLLLKQTLLPEIDIVQMKYANQLAFNTTYNFDVEYRPKLYKRLRTFRWVEPVHENVVLAPAVYDSDIIVMHMPISNHAQRDFQTYQRIIHRDGRLSAKLYEMYARELFIAGTDQDFNDAFSYFRDFAEKEECTERERKLSECILVRCYMINNGITGLLKFSLRNVADGKGCSEVCYMLGEFFFSLQDYKEAVIWYYNAAYETESELNIHYNGDYPLKRLAECYHFLGNKEQEEAFQTLYESWCITNKE